MIKNSKILIVFLLNLTLILSAIFYALFLIPASIYAEPNNYYVKIKTSGRVGTVYFPYSEYENDPDNFSITLTVDYNFEVGDTITYYYLKTDSNSLKYQAVEAIKVVTSENRLTAGDIKVYPYTWEGIGSYNIFARIWDDSKGIDVRADSITLVLEKPLASNLKLKILKPEIIQGESNELKTYFLQAEVKLNDKPFNSGDYVINWYVIDQGNQIIGSNISAIFWKPTEAGNYTIFAEIKGAGVRSPEITIVVNYNQTEIILFSILGIVVVMTLFVIVTTIIKVKSERVW